MLTSSSDDERAYTRRYTDEGINVVALDPNNRSLYRARPEGGLRSRHTTDRFTRPDHSVGSWLGSLVFGVVVLVVIGLLIARYVA